MCMHQIMMNNEIEQIRQDKLDIINSIQQTQYNKLDRQYYKMSTSSIVSQISIDFKRQRPLQGHLPSLIATLESSKRVVFTNMNDKQKLAQLQQLIQEQMKKITKSLGMQQIDLEQAGGQQSVQQDAGNQEELSGGQQSGQIDNDGELIQDQQDEASPQMDIQAGDQGQQFKQPQFSSKNQHHRTQQEEQLGAQQQEDSMDEQQQDGQQQEGQQQGEEEQDIGSEEDVGLYGQQLNQQEMEDYDNQFDQEQFKEFQKQFGGVEAADSSTRKNKKSSKKRQDLNDNVDDNIEDNFDHFRQIQLENQKEQVTTVQRTQIDNQIDRIQGKIIGRKDWTMKGQIKARQRPSNSLLEYDLQFSSGIKYAHQITEQKNTQLEELIKKRILSDMFDDRTRFVNTSHIREHFGSLKQVSRQKSKMGLGELYESQFKNFLGIGDNKNDKLKTQIMDSFKQLNYFLDSLSNFSFTPKPTKDTIKKGQSQAIIVQQKVPLTLWNGQKQVQKQGKLTFQSQKQVDNQAKRLKNKRIARQRKKQLVKKKLNKKIQYGGITKFQAQAKQKALANNKPLKVDGANMKYNKSASFFKNMNQNKGGKPNPDISKMKI